MNRRTPVGLLIVTLLLLLLVALRPSSPPVGEEEAAPEALATPLGSRINDTAVVELIRPGETLRLRRDDSGHWGLESRGGYSADPKRLRKLLLAASRFRALEPRTGNPERFAKLGVEDPDAEGSDSTRLRLLDREGDALLDVIVGNTRSAAGRLGEEEVYIRLPGASRAWLAAPALPVKGEPVEWLDRRIVDVAGERLARIVVRHPDGETLIFRRGEKEEAGMELEGVGEEEKIKAPWRLRQVTRLFEHLDLDDVARADERPLDRDKAVKVEAETREGLKLIAWIAEGEGSGSLIQLEATAVEREGDEAAETGNTDEKTPAPREESEAINARVTGWTYTIPRYMADYVRIHRGDLVEPKSNPEQN